MSRSNKPNGKDDDKKGKGKGKGKVASVGKGYAEEDEEDDEDLAQRRSSRRPLGASASSSHDQDPGPDNEPVRVYMHKDENGEPRPSRMPSLLLSNRMGGSAPPQIIEKLMETAKKFARKGTDLDDIFIEVFVDDIRMRPRRFSLAELLQDRELVGELNLSLSRYSYYNIYYLAHPAELLQRTERAAKPSSGMKMPDFVADSEEIHRFTFIDNLEYLKYLSKQLVFDKLHDFTLPRLKNIKGTGLKIEQELTALRQKIRGELKTLFERFSPAMDRKQKIDYIKWLITVLELSKVKLIEESLTEMEKGRSDDFTDIIELIVEASDRKNPKVCGDMEALIMDASRKKAMEGHSEVVVLSKREEINDHLARMDQSKIALINNASAYSGPLGRIVAHPPTFVDGAALGTSTGIVESVLLSGGVFCPMVRRMTITTSSVQGSPVEYEVIIEAVGSFAEKIRITNRLRFNNGQVIESSMTTDLNRVGISPGISVARTFLDFVLGRRTYSLTELLGKFYGDQSQSHLALFIRRNGLTRMRAMSLDGPAEDVEVACLAATDRLANAIALELAVQTIYDPDNNRTLKIVSTANGKVVQIIIVNRANNFDSEQQGPYSKKYRKGGKRAINIDDGKMLISELNVLFSINIPNGYKFAGMRMRYENLRDSLLSICTRQEAKQIRRLLLTRHAGFDVNINTNNISELDKINTSEDHIIAFIHRIETANNIKGSLSSVVDFIPDFLDFLVNAERVALHIKKRIYLHLPYQFDNNATPVVICLNPSGPAGEYHLIVITTDVGSDYSPIQCVGLVPISGQTGGFLSTQSRSTTMSRKMTHLPIKLPLSASKRATRKMSIHKVEPVHASILNVPDSLGDISVLFDLSLLGPNVDADAYLASIHLYPKFKKWIQTKDLKELGELTTIVKVGDYYMSRSALISIHNEL